MVYVLLADGFEEIEALTPVDILRRGGVEVTTVGITGRTVMGSHGIAVTADATPDEIAVNEALELARLLDSEKAVPFINGVLAKVIQIRG